ncbi:protein prenylyltransferase [Venturia nashicola]|uniref:Geranylgeranyl transferase type-2 subunit alpha n=1 Tax=Venturia nashicola TaxID=86259 RepID=A0A4Z1PP53_9PEZI|nr:protein prenylyltransferase [Venturia nashicola]
MASSHGVPRLAREGDGELVEENIREYRSLLHLIAAKIQQKIFTDEVLSLTSTLLKKNPEYYTIWNHRRRILLHQFTNAPNHDAENTSSASPAPTIRGLIAKDLRFIVPLLVQYPKCYWIWNYRLWMLHQAEKHLEPPTVQQLWQEELDLVSKMLTRDERNFHGWGYRRHVVTQLENFVPPGQPSLVEQEFAYTSKMIKAKLQNFSALHYRSKLIPRLLEERKADGKARRAMLEAELDNMQDALIDPFNQSAWFYHQYLMSTLDPGCLEKDRIVLDSTLSDRLQYYEQELERITEITEDFDDCKWVYEALLQYSIDYSKLKGSSSSNQKEIQSWLDTLQRLDPMRSGRWRELENSLKL